MCSVSVRALLGASACVCWSGCANMCDGWRACAPWSCLLRAKEKPSHQKDYRTATTAAHNGRNKTPFNEDTNLRNATLLRPASLLQCPVIFPSRLCLRTSSPKAPFVTFVCFDANFQQHLGFLWNFVISGLQAELFCPESLLLSRRVRGTSN